MIVNRLIVGHILRKEEYAPFIVKLNADQGISSFIEEVSLIVSPEMLDTIVNYGNSFSNSKK